MKDLLFIIPMKDPLKAKSRLADVMPDEVRARLALALFRRMLGFLREAQPEVSVLVVTESVSIEDEALAFGAQVLQQTETGLNAAVKQAADWAKEKGFSSICVLPADLADPSTTDLDRLLKIHSGVVVVPAHDGGTNALLVSPPDAIQFRYGKGSCIKHQTEAEEAGVSCTIVPLESLKYDIDTSADLARVKGVKWA